ncbi:NEP1-interacting protein 1-like isoform X2 [Macadamia integrifolia]|uniref:NEP1-interacting protein 1-like isoform X2 n=1 Tax=Macadamia integrifolia TaxID=60698 RepID=UPI001C4F84F5|nr:NEP1-interacting protein 1-like isoform X2 [Macadamia integrifolia]
MGGFRIGFLLRVVRMAVFISSTCVFALGGAIVGAITGAVTGQTTETGFCRGAGIGAISGAVVAFELLESLIEGESSSKIALIGSLINGKVFREWINSMETSYGETSDIYDVGGIKGVSFNFINKLPVFNFTHSEMMATCDDFCCTICLQDFREEERARRLPNCLHFFHLPCIDGWLVRHGSCPICRQDV